MIPYPPACFDRVLFQRWDPYGYRLWPSRTLRRRYPPLDGREVTIASNADGFRGDDLHRRDGRPRIVVAGDSMVFGAGVEADERVTEALARLEPGWRVDNMGMVGYGPDLMLRAVEAVGLDPPPAVVVLAIFSHDLYRVVPEYPGVGFPIPRFVLRDGTLATVPYPARAAWERTAFVQGLRYVYWRYTAATFPLNAAILDRFLALAGARGFRPALAFVPGPRDGRDDRRRRTWLAAWAGARGVAFADMTEALRAAGGERLYLPRDAHWNADGHRAAAVALRALVEPLVGG
jgi:hypothetical protein